MFRAALRAGVSITAWMPHFYRVPYYELNGWLAERDAAIYQPNPNSDEAWVDLRFHNLTDTWVQVQAWADGTTVEVSIYGPETDWDVRVSDTKTGPVLPPLEDTALVDLELPPGTVQQTE